tara:strand:+ start:41 stop:478 length:438 start_codon:yes stop_codon:yes gene_type:complete
MGLDQYAYYRKPEPTEEAVVRKLLDERREDFPIMQWRKVWELQEYMHNLWFEKEGFAGTESPPEFNCIEVELNEEDLNKLSNAIEKPEFWAADEESAVWFGNSDQRRGKEKLDESYKPLDDTREFIKESKRQISKGNRVYYNSWY